MDETAAQLQAEAHAAIAGAPADPVIPGADPLAAPVSTQADDEAAYAFLTGAALDITCGLTCPAWAVTDVEKSKLGGAMAKACAVWFPGAIPEKFAVLIVVAGAAAEIALARRDPQTGKIRPRFYEATEKTGPAPQLEAQAASH